MTSDFALGPIRVRLEVLPIVIGVGVLSGSWQYALALFASIAVHEVGHAFAAQLYGSRAPLTLQMTGGGSYVRDLPLARVKILVLLAGPIASAIFAGLAIFAGPEFFYTAIVWAIYQAMPFPPLDGGQILRILLSQGGIGATFAWRIGWVLGFAVAVGLVLIDSNYLQPVVLLSGMALILGRGESGYVRHLDAYALWERGEHRALLAQVKNPPRYLDRDDRAGLLELGLFAAKELDDPAAAEELAAQLPPFRPVVMSTGEWLLIRDHAAGAKIAQRALDALAEERVKLTGPEDRERYADLTFRYAVYEARALRADSALGLLERAAEFGFSDRDRAEAEPAFKHFLATPRWSKVLDRLGGTSESATPATSGSTLQS